MAPEPRSIEPLKGKKTIQVVVYFWTNGIAETKGKIRPGYAWDKGTILVKGNKSHGISTVKGEKFHSWKELPQAIEASLREAGVVLQDKKRKAA